MPHELRFYQKEAVQSIFDYFKSGGSGNPLIVIPTGGGKSLCLADFCRTTLTNWPDQKIIMIAHRKELLEQNAQELWEQWPSAPIGIYSAGLGMKQVGRPLTIAGIGSIYRIADRLEKVDILLIDEAHLVPNKGLGMYRKLINSLKEKNPHLKVVGLTATPFRLDSGFLHQGGDRVFTDIAYDIDVRMLIELGHLVPLVGKLARSSADLSDVRIRGGEFVDQDVQRAFESADLVSQAVDEMIRFGQNRKSWLVFSSGVEHGYHILNELRSRGISSEIVVGETDAGLRRETVNDFRNGTLKALVNCGVFTTGFNARNVDMISILRATQSTGLYVQIVGRGMRTSPETGKTDCLILDYGGNIERHGPVDQIRIVSRGSGGDTVELSLAPTKGCPNCQEAISLACTECPVCGHIMERSKPMHEARASDSNPLSDGGLNEMNVHQVTYTLHEKEGSPPSMRVTYFSSAGTSVSEWWCFEHEKKWAVTQAKKNWSNACRPEYVFFQSPVLITEALERSRELMFPKKLWIKKEGKFDRIVSKLYPTLEEIRAEENEEILF